MCHFYANPLSLILAIPSMNPDCLQRYLTKTHLNAIRALPSLRQYVEEKLAENDVDEVKAILFDDKYFRSSLLLSFINESEKSAQDLRLSLTVLSKLSEFGGGKMKLGLGDLYLNVLQGEITHQTPFIREL